MRKNKPFELVNIYEKDGIKPFLLKSHNPNYNIHYITVPFRMLIIGSSGSGKTMTLYNLLRAFSKTFQNVYIVTKAKAEPIYQYIESKIDKVNKNPRNKVKYNCTVTEGVESLPDLDTFDKNEQSLVVLDDLVLVKNQSKIEEYYIRCRKLNISIVYISQSYYAIPKMIRNNVNYLIIKQVSSMRNLKMISTEYSLDLDKTKLKKLYDYCVSEKSSFLLIDIDNKETRFRKNLDFVIDVDAIQ
jgi:ABC-type dipeptide/oligopeptide/nickel transport system ATPase component